jgi:hypothetical protein
MGSHGGATAEGQRQLIAHYGVTEAAMGCPVRAEMETRSLGRTASGVDARMAEAAWESDGILLVNRVKPHTDYKGPIESGLAKICAIGLGKYDGAREIHRHLFTVGLGEAIRGVAERLWRRADPGRDRHPRERLSRDGEDRRRAGPGSLRDGGPPARGGRPPDGAPPAR